MTEKFISVNIISETMENLKKCFEEAKELHEELRAILNKLKDLNEEDPKSLMIFKADYDKLLKLLEKSKELAKCPVPAIKINDSCHYPSPLEPLFFSEYTLLPDPNEPYTVIDDIRRYGKNGHISKIKQLLEDIDGRLENYIRGINECKVDLDGVEDDVDSMMLKLGINPDDFLEDNTQDNESNDSN